MTNEERKLTFSGNQATFSRFLFSPARKRTCWQWLKRACAEIWFEVTGR